jgi:hypothetical protein
MSSVFISYRREDSKYFADQLARDLRGHFGEEEVFLDLNDIPPGAKFDSEIARRIKLSKVVLVVIGPKWLGSDSRAARIKETGDWVRKEIETALHHDTCLIPVLIEGARMPEKKDLPDSLWEFTISNAIEFTRKHYLSDVDNLVRELRKRVKPSRETILNRLAAGQHESAVKVLTSTIENSPRDADNHFYLALALLRGRRPKTLTRPEVLEIENHLRKSCELNPEAAHPFLVWAAIKWDYFVVNGFSPPEEAWALIEEAEDRRLDGDALRAICSILHLSQGNPVAEILSVASRNLSETP